MKKTMSDNLCLDCNENESIGGFYCFGCGIDRYFSEVTIFESSEAN